MPSSGIEAVDQMNSMKEVTDGLTKSAAALRSEVGELNKSVVGLGTGFGQATKAMSHIATGSGMIPMNQTIAPPGGAGGFGGGGRVMSGSGTPDYGTNNGYVPASTGGAGGDGGGSGAFGIGGQSFSGAGGSGLLSNLMNLLLIGPQYMFNRVEGNRALAASISPDVRSMSLLSGKPSNDIIQAFGQKMPLMGSPQQMAAAGAEAGGYGYGDLLRPQNGSGRFFEGTRQMQLLTPGVGAQQLVKQQGDFLGNIGAQQSALMITGGAMSGFTVGAQPKTLVEWAEGVLKWFESLRPGKDKGRPFSADEISTQMFPGSNMRAWFQTMQTPSYMIDAFWKYAINMRSGTKSTFEDVFTQGDMGQDLALKRLGTATSGAQRELSFMAGGGSGSSWYQQYTKREDADTIFNKVLNQIVDKKLAPTSGGFLNDMIAGTPTPIANMLAQMMFSTVPNMISGTVSSIPIIGNMLGDPIGDVGDVGDYGEYGATGTAGMDQSFAKRLRSMMGANPRLRINSGFREGTTQSRLAAKGTGRVTPNLDKSMHTKGLAADLGPRSEYGWIAQNASRFGLDQASRHGEPWHVGPPGTIGDPVKGCCAGCGGLGAGIGDPSLSSLMSRVGDIGDPSQRDAMQNTACGKAMMQIWPKELWPWALQVIYDESRGKADAIGYAADKNGNRAQGCFQMMMPMHKDLFGGKDPHDPAANAAAALKLFAEGGPKHWSPSLSPGRNNLLPPNAQAIAAGKAATSAGTSLISNATDLAGNVVSTVADAAGSAISGATEFIKSMAGGPFDVFKDLALGFAKGDFGSLFNFDIIGKMTKLMGSLTSGLGFSPGGGAMNTSAGFANMLSGRIDSASGLSGIFGGNSFWDGGDPIGDPAASMAGTVSPIQMSTYAGGGGTGNISLQGGTHVVMNNSFNITGGSAQDASRTAQVISSHLNSMMNDRSKRAS